MLERGYEIIAIDSLKNSSSKSLARVLEILNKKNKKNKIKFIKGDLRDKCFIRSIFEDEYNSKESISAVIHLAALKSVPESIKYPLHYWENNVVGSMNLVESMEDFNCRTIVFSSSATVYEGSDSLLKENHKVNPSNPYASTKVVVERLLMDFYLSTKKNWSVINLIYFNPIGAHISGMIGEDPKASETNIFPIINAVASGKKKYIEIFGKDWGTPDGTCIRDYIHIMDLAEGHLFALEKLLKNSKQFLNINLGTGSGVSVLELISTFEKVNSISIPFVFSKRRSGDQAITVADNNLAIDLLDWKPKRTLADMCLDGWRWQKLNPNGYQ